MDWIRENKTLASLMGVFLAAAAALGFLVVKAWLAFGESRERFDTTNNSLAAMKSADLFPSQENLDKKKAAVDEYEQKVTRLSRVLLSLQPETEAITETDFQAKLKARIDEVRKLAGKTTRLPGEFALAFPDYTSSLPKSAGVARELSDYLDTADAVARTLIESGVDSVEMFDRTQLASEKGEPAPPPQTSAKAKGKGAPAPKSDVIASAKPGQKDAVGVIGQEKLKVYLEIDLIKFVNPEVASAPAGN